jgi:hypothetical protein
MRTEHLPVVALVFIAACATGTSGTAGSTHSGSTLTADEIAIVNVEGKTAFDIVSRLRPKWLVARGVQPLRGETDSSEYALVVIDNRATGRTNALRDVPAEQVADMHFYDPAEVGGRFGPRGTSGVIQIRLKGATR